VDGRFWTPGRSPALLGWGIYLLLSGPSSFPEIKKRKMIF
jgi:hypothetical protein